MGCLVACFSRDVRVAGVDQNGGYVVYDPVVRVCRSVVRVARCGSRVSLRRPVLVDQPSPVTVSVTVVGNGVGPDPRRDEVNDEPSYLILADRSFGQYLYDAVHDATTEFSSLT